MNPAATTFCDIFGVQAPVVNAPMANIAGGALAEAVVSGGGLGLIGGGYGDLSWIEQHGDLGVRTLPRLGAKGPRRIIRDAEMELRAPR